MARVNAAQVLNDMVNVVSALAGPVKLWIPAGAFAHRGVHAALYAPVEGPGHELNEEMDLIKRAVV